jgi:hypothetical protein
LKFGHVDKKDVLDLKNLLSIVNPADFKSENVCCLNPSFYYSSRIVGGADADLIIDNTLLDIKTTKHFTFTRQYFNQLLGYLALIVIERQFFNHPDFKKKRPEDLDPHYNWVINCKIERIGVYYSRFGHLQSINISDIFPDEGILEAFGEFFEYLIFEKYGLGETDEIKELKLKKESEFLEKENESLRKQIIDLQQELAKEKDILATLKQERKNKLKKT